MSDEELRRLRHDLRSPLVVISGFAQLLASERDIGLDARRDYGRRIEGAAAELQRLVDDSVS